MKILNKLWDVDADSTKGKLILLLMDKLLVGAVIALVFVLYDTQKGQEQHNFETRMLQLTHDLEVERNNQAAERNLASQQIQQEYERSKILKESLPLIFDEERDITTRGYLLRSLLRTKAIDGEAGVRFGNNLVSSGLEPEHFMIIAKEALPEGIPALAQYGHSISVKPDVIVDPESGRETGDVSKELQVARLWRAALLESIPELETSDSAILEETKNLAKYLGGLYPLLSPGNLVDAIELSRSSSRGIALIGNISRIEFSGDDKEAADAVSLELTRDNSNLQNIYLARSILSILNYRNEPPAGYICSSLAKILSEPDLENVSKKIQVEHYWLRFKAGEKLMMRMQSNIEQLNEGFPIETINSNTWESVLPILKGYINNFLIQARKVDTKEEIIDLSSKWQSGKLLRLAVDFVGEVAIIGGKGAGEAREILADFRSLDDELFRGFPFLKASVERGMETRK